MSSKRRPAQLRILLDGELPGATNMAIDDVLLAGCSPYEYSMRWYSWARPTVSLGYAQRWRDGFDRRCAGRLGVDLVRRRTGGRAVLHAGELTYAALWGVLGDSGAGAARQSVGLYELLVDRPSRRTIASTLSEAVAEALGLTPRIGSLSRAERVAEVRQRRLYNDSRHTLRR
jgi:hypothetical protein